MVTHINIPTRVSVSRGDFGELYQLYKIIQTKVKLNNSATNALIYCCKASDKTLLLAALNA